jgi:hypothetical protein
MVYTTAPALLVFSTIIKRSVLNGTVCVLAVLVLLPEALMDCVHVGLPGGDPGW